MVAVNTCLHDGIDTEDPETPVTGREPQTELSPSVPNVLFTVLKEPSTTVQAPPVAKLTTPEISHTPAVQEIEVIVFAVLLTNATGAPPATVADICSPIKPAVGAVFWFPLNRPPDCVVGFIKAEEPLNVTAPY